jgi:hypothetical protein
MTVKELKEKLKDLDDSTEVVLSDESGYAPLRNVHAFQWADSPIKYIELSYIERG